MDTPDPNRKISVARNGKLIGEYHQMELESLLETGHLQNDDVCLASETAAWIPVGDFLKRENHVDESRNRKLEDSGSWRERHRQRRGGKNLTLALAMGFFTLVVVTGAGLWVRIISGENAELQTRLAHAEAASSEWKHKYENVLFAAREVASSDLVRGKVIIRDVSGKRVVLPGIKVRLYRRAEIESFLAARHASIAEAGGTDPTRLAAHFLKNMPAPVEITTTDSDGRFECKVAEPGEYVIQTSIRSAKTGTMRLWFVTFDSRDPLNTSVDITESDVVQQFNPLLMLVEGR